MGKREPPPYLAIEATIRPGPSRHRGPETP
jgi:hypothetical protein